MGLTIFHKTFPTFTPSMKTSRKIPWNNVSPTKHCYELEPCYDFNTYRGWTVCNKAMLKPVPGKSSGSLVYQDPNVSKSNRLRVDIFFRFCCFHSFEVYSSTDSFKMIGNSPEISNFNRLFLKLNRLAHTRTTPLGPARKTSPTYSPGIHG